MEKWFINQEVFIHPFTCTIAGPTQSGKTSLLKNILIFNSILFDKPLHTITFCYSTWQTIYNELGEIILNIRFVKGIPGIEELDQEKNNLIILDDLMKELERIVQFKNCLRLILIITLMLARQMFPKKVSFFMEAFEDATSKPHGYIFIDSKQSTENRNRIQTGITPDETRII
ncbi:unnamed protein product [Brachionus calyciflorus]|uniref:Uncharacterized protein n=1 Tax=Brachionus calyciflorus TaxID=104777 RepID=A0A814RSN6_9BILA|nr:unnamed protein product [Brachionus calyciflorus]